jgi:glycosyltransferase involved in cell wall biosynthesis
MLGYGAAVFFWIARAFGTHLWVNPDGIEWARAKWGFLARMWLKAMEWLAVRTADLIVADSEAVLKHLLKRHGPVTSHAVIAYGAVIPETKPSAKPLSALDLAPSDYYLVVCRIEPENHVREIIRGYLESGSQRPLVIVGDHKATSGYCRALRNEYASFAPRIRFVGPVFDSETLTSLRYHCWTYIHGHSVGGTNPSLLESLACGNIVIAHDNVFNREVATRVARYFNSSNQLAMQLRAVEQYSTEQRQARMSEARERVLSRYSWDQVISEYASLLSPQTVESGSSETRCVRK